MLLWHSIVLGIIEGLTEFLPISSTFHLLFATRILGLQVTEFNAFFDVFIQSAAILAVAVLYFKEWLQDKKLLMNAMISFLPTAIVGLVLHKMIKTVFFSSPVLMLASFAVVGVVFIVVEVLIRKEHVKLNKSLDEISWKHALLIGLCQAAAVVPGVSRAGAVIVAMMLMGYKRDEAAKYSFTLAIPTILAASVLDVIKTRELLFAAGMNEFLLLGAGSLAAFISALVIVRWFIQFLRGHSLKPFGVYRFVLTGLLVLFGFWRS
jgi:undecaprenyl-diphosphatase